MDLQHQKRNLVLDSLALDKQVRYFLDSDNRHLQLSQESRIILPTSNGNIIDFDIISPYSYPHLKREGNEQKTFHPCSEQIPSLRIRYTHEKETLTVYLRRELTSEAIVFSDDVSDKLGVSFYIIHGDFGLYFPQEIKDSTEKYSLLKKARQSMIALTGLLKGWTEEGEMSVPLGKISVEEVELEWDI